MSGLGRHNPRMDAAETWPPPDPLGEALHYLRMDGAFYCRSELTAPWGMTLDPMPGYLWFHVVTTGAVLLEVDTENEMWLHPGAVSLVPHGEGHVLRSEPGAPAPGVMELELEHPSDRYEIIRHGGGGAKTILICGAVRFDHPAARNLVGILPQVIHIDASDGPRATWMQRALELMAAEAREFHPGGEAVITRLADVLVIQAIRGWIETAPAARTGWLGALQDPQIGRALALIHATRPATGRSPRSPTSWLCHAPHSPRGSPNWSANRRCSTSPDGGCSLLRAPWKRRAPQLLRLQTGSGTDRRQLSRAPSSVSRGIRPERSGVAPRLSPALNGRVMFRGAG